MKLRPNPFLEKKLRLSSTSSPPKLTWFQQARDSVALIVSLTSLITAVMALRNTISGPQPFVAQLTGDSVTILRSDQFLVGSPPKPALALRDERGMHADFPLLLLQPTLANRAATPYGVGVRSIESDLVFSQAGRTLFRSTYFWWRVTSSSAVPDEENKVDLLTFDSAINTAPFDLPGGGTWSREVLFIPRQAWNAASWKPFNDQITENCSQECEGEILLRVRFDNGVSLTEPCNFSVDAHVLAHMQGKERRYFSSPTCSPIRLK